MGTRFYLSNTASAGITPAVHAGWEDGTHFTRKRCFTTKQNTAIEEDYNVKGAGSPFDLLIRQYISDPISAQTISGTVKGQIKCGEDIASLDCCRAIVIKVVSNDGSVLRGTLLEHFPDPLTSEFSLNTGWLTGNTNRNFPPSTAINEVVAQANDRIVIEIGARSFLASADYDHDVVWEFGDDAATDLPEDESTTALYNPWIEFSAILFPFAGAAAGSIELSGIGIINQPTAAAPAFAAAGYLGAIGAGAVEVITPGTLDVAAGGHLQIMGAASFTVTRPSPLVSSFAAADLMILGGAGRMDFLSPAASTITELAAAGFLALMSQGQVDFGKSLVLEMAAAGFISLGGAALPTAGVIFPTAAPVKAFASSGCLEFSGTGTMEVPQRAVAAFAANTGLGGVVLLLLSGDIAVGFIRPLVSEMAAEGEYLIEAPGAVEEGVFDTYVLTGFRNEPSIYSNFNFNSYARYRDQFYGAKEDGIYLLEGEDDAGVEIHPGMKIGPANFGTDRQKRLHLLRLGGECDKARVKVSNGNGAAGYFDLEEGRVPVSRDIQGREITIEIADFESLNHLEIVPKVLARR